MSRFEAHIASLWAAVRASVLRDGKLFLVALVAGLPPLFWVLDAMYRASLTTLGRDQGIFQYIAWALSRGARDYRDIRDVNGPLTHFVHAVFLALGGVDEHRFRVLDLAASSAAFAFAGSCLSGVGLDHGGRPPALFTRIGWAFAGWVVLSSQYLGYLYWDLAQRESFCDWFVLASVGLQLVAERPGIDPKRARYFYAAAGALSLIAWFGKPTYALFTVVQLATALVDDRGGRPRLTRKASVGWFVAGAAVGTSTQLAFLLRYGDIAAFARLYFVDAPQLYRFIWPRSAVEILSLHGYASLAANAFVTSAAMIALIAERIMPRRLLAIALFPLVGLISVVVQRKGFPYHFHPVSAGTHLQWLVSLVWFTERYQHAPRSVLVLRMMPTFAAAALALKVAVQMQYSPHIEDIWILEKGATAELRESRDYLVYFRDRDYFPWELRETAAYLRAHTEPNERVQIYGMDPYVLFLAQRLSATPYIYAYDLNCDTALQGGFSLQPTAEQSQRIQSARDAHEADLFERLQRDPPAAFVFFDKAPLITEGDAWVDFEEHSAKTAAWVRLHYVQMAMFGDDRVWLRKDVSARPERAVDAPSVPGSPSLGAVPSAPL